MEGKNFLRADSALIKMQATPPAGFSFDLQRFDDEGTTQETPSTTFVEGENKAEGVYYVFSCIKKVGDVNKTYYGTAEEFTTDNLGNASAITLLEDFAVGEDVTKGLATWTYSSSGVPTDISKATAALEISGSCTLDLNGKTLTIANYTSGILIKNNASLTLKDTGGNGKIESTWDLTATAVNSNGEVYTDSNGGNVTKNYSTSVSSIKSYVRSKGCAVIDVGDINTAGSQGATFIMEGGTLTGNVSGLCVGNGCTVNVSDGCTIKSEKACGVYFGNSKDTSNGGGTFTMSGGTITTGTGSQLPPIQVTGSWSNNHVKIEISGNSKLEFTAPNSTWEQDNGEYKGNLCVIYNGGNGDITIKDNAQITSTGTGVDVRAGSLTVDDNAVINSTATAYSSNKASSSSGAASAGAGISLAQHVTKQDTYITVKGNAKVNGAVALAISNPNNVKEGTLTVKVEGGTLRLRMEATLLYLTLSGVSTWRSKAVSLMVILQLLTVARFLP